MIGSTFQSAFSGLQAAAHRIDVASRNINGAATPGYVRREVATSSALSGVRIEGVVRAKDLGLQEEVMGLRASLAGLETELAGQARLVELLGDPRDRTDLGSALAGLSDSLVAVAGQPDDAGLQLEAVQAAREVTRRLNTLDSSIREQRGQGESAIGDAVGVVNERLREVRELNEAVAALPPQADRSELLDRRDQALGEIMKRLPVRVVPETDGAVTVLTGTGVTLLAGPQLTELRLDGGGAGGAPLRLQAGGLDITPGSGPPQAPAEGTIAAGFRLRDTMLPEAQGRIDAIAGVLVEAFRTADATVTGPDQEGLFVDRAGAGAPQAGLAGRIGLNPRVDPTAGGEPWRLRTGIHAAGPGVPGEQTQARAFAAVLETAHVLGTDGNAARLVDHANALTAAQGVRRTGLESAVAHAGAMKNTLEARIAASEGVDLDRELQDMMLFERSWAASASVLQAAQRMYDTLLGSVRG